MATYRTLAAGYAKDWLELARTERFPAMRDYDLDRAAYWMIEAIL